MRRLLVGLCLLLAPSCRTTGGSHVPDLSAREQAQVLVQRGDAAAAVPLLEKLFAEKPTDLPLARLLAEAHVRAGSGAALIERLGTRDDAVSHYVRGLVLFSKSADAGAAALVEFRRSVALAPAEPEYQYRLGIALLESERDEEALLSLRQATALAPDHSGWFLPLAKALYRAGDARAAVQAIRTTVTGSPTPAEVKLARALMGQISDPSAAVPKAVRPQLEQAMQWLEGADVPAQAIVQLEEIEHDYPDLPVVHTLLGLAWTRLDDAGKGVDEFKRAIELAPDDGKNHLYLGELYLSRQRAKTAREHFEKALERNPVLDQAWFHLGDMALEQQDLVAARGHFQSASRLVPDNEAARGKLALVYQLEGDWPAADRELHAVVDEQPDNLEFTLRLGILHAERALKAKQSGERKEATAEARKWLTRVLEKQPENALASRALERLSPP